MDVRREGVVEARRRRRLIYSALGLVGAIALTFWLLGLEPAAPNVDRSTVYLGKVERGEMLRKVSAPGTLVPTEILWIPAVTQGRVDRRVLLPGAVVEPDSVIVELSDPELVQSTQDAELALRAAEAAYEDRKVSLESRMLNERAAARTIESEFKQAQLQAQANQNLLDEGLISELDAQLSHLRAEELESRNELEQERLAITQQAVAAQLASERARLEQAKALHTLRRSQLEALSVRAGIHGVLQEVPVEVGQQVQPGTNLARVAQPEHLKAELRVSETQAKDIAIGQVAEIDTRNGVIEGAVERIDPSVRNGTVTVDVTLISELPRGARPDLSVDGTIELERLDDVLYVGRPAYGQAGGTIGLFKLDAEGDTARRVQVHLGKSSVTFIEVVSGLIEGDQVVLSDTSQWDDYDRIRIN